MKKATILIALIFLPVLASAHPGKTNRVGGHKCWKGCGQWDLFYGEYHLHDKDFKPIRITRRPVGEAPEVAVPLAPRNERQEEPPAKSPEPTPQASPENVNIPTATPQPLPVVSEAAFLALDPYLIARMALLLLLLVALLLLRTRRADKDDKS